MPVKGLAALGLLSGVAIGLAVVGTDWRRGAAEETGLTCEAVDGDTLRCGDRRVRLYGIDAPEMPGHCRPGRECTPGDPYASLASLRQLVAGHAVACRKQDTDVYGRDVSRCAVDGHDLSCAQIDAGHAVRRYGIIWCGAEWR